jgi:hypothetical protein
LKPVKKILIKWRNGKQLVRNFLNQDLDHPQDQNDPLLQLQKVHELMTSLNRLQSLKAQLNKKQKTYDNTDRRARTRTLIQMGGLLNMIGIPQLCGIEDGDDLQQDLENQDKAATLLGMLVHLNETLANTTVTLDTNSLEGFKQRGIRLLKDHEAQKTRI